MHMQTSSIVRGQSVKFLTPFAVTTTTSSSRTPPNPRIASSLSLFYAHGKHFLLLPDIVLAFGRHSGRPWRRRSGDMMVDAGDEGGTRYLAFLASSSAG